MAKQKFSLTADLVKVEPEPKEVDFVFGQNNNVEEKIDSGDVILKSVAKKNKITVRKELINFRIDVDLKKDFQRWCFEEGVNMSDIVSEMIRSKVKKFKV